jgi:hypothetical protein
MQRQIEAFTIILEKKLSSNPKVIENRIKTIKKELEMELRVAELREDLNTIK